MENFSTVLSRRALGPARALASDGPESEKSSSVSTGVLIPDATLFAGLLEPDPTLRFAGIVVKPERREIAVQRLTMGDRRRIAKTVFRMSGLSDESVERVAHG